MSTVQGLQYAFLEAAYKEKDLDKVKELIGQGCPVNTTNQVKFPRIHRKTYMIRLVIDKYKPDSTARDVVSVY